MREVLVWKKTIAEYLSEFSRTRHERPRRCKHCGSTRLHRWGTYRRYASDESAPNQIPVQRYRCVKCLRTHSPLPSFCLRGIGCAADFVMRLLECLIFRLRKVSEVLKRQAYRYLRRFRENESLWLFFLRTKGFGDFPRDKKERGRKIFAALLSQYHETSFMTDFLAETGRCFMAAN